MRYFEITNQFGFGLVENLGYNSALSQCILQVALESDQCIGSIPRHIKLGADSRHVEACGGCKSSRAPICMSERMAWAGET